MRLKKLTLQAFGSFKDKVIIDFEEKKIDHGLLLISGDTGSGKTTIFDAICYALYGKTSGETRDSNSLRSHWASPDIKTFVNLEFFYKNKLYEVERSPEYYTSTGNGEKEVKHVSYANLDLDGTKVTGIRNVTDELEKLIGLDYKQFKQVAMLSQGEFTKFLLAKSDEKTTIFRKIFDTEFFDVMQNKLKSDVRSIEDKLKLVEDKIDTEKKNLTDIIDVYGLSDDEVITTLDNKIEEDNILVSKTKDAKNIKEKQKTELSIELSNLKELNEKIEDYKTACKKLDVLLSSNPNIEEEKEIIGYNIKVANSITKELNGLNRDKGLLGEKQRLLRENNQILESKQKEYDEKEEQFKKIDNFPKELENLQDEIIQLSDKNKKYGDYLNKNRELADIKKEYFGDLDKEKNQNSAILNMKMEYYLDISVEIADTLEEGKECPVCGSKDHPKPAKPTRCDFTKDDIDFANEQLEKIRKKIAKEEEKIRNLEELIQQLDIPEGTDIVSEKEKNNELLMKKNQEIVKLDEEFKKLSKCQKDLIATITDLKGNQGHFAKDIGELEKSIESFETNLENLYKDNNTSLEEYECKKLDPSEFSDLQSKIDKFNEIKNTLDTKIQTLGPEIKDKEVVDVAEKEEQLNEITEEYKKLEVIYTESYASLQQLMSSTKNIKNYLEESNEVKKEYAIVKILSDTANGSLVGKQKINFENYVQAYYMQNVLVEANKRFIKMTEGRYKLKRKETETKSRGKTGLDFSIFDSHTGKERDVTSLSGGEKFEASLALALGLSDTITNNLGGVKIDSLFIDEGFGSLDAEALTKSLNILYDLSGNDKLIGVISHVSELKSRIDNKILVNKTNTGSEVDIEANN